MGTLRSGGGFTLGSDGVCTLGRDEECFPRSGGGCGGGVGGVWTACCRICATCRYYLRREDPKYSERCKEVACLSDRMLIMSSSAWQR